MARERTPQLIGREDALRRLGAALDRVREPAGALVLVEGEAGIGKTRLVEEFGARHADVRVVRGACVPDVPYAPWSDALWWLDREEPRCSDEVSERSRAALARLLPNLTAPAGDDAGPEALYEAVLELLGRAAAHGPLVLVVDDVHWIDPASRDLLRYLAGNLRRVPILLVVAYRPEDGAAERELLAQLGRLAADHVELVRLPDAEVATIAEILLGSRTETVDVDRIVRDSEGNPLFAEELVAAAGTGAIPANLRDLMLARFLSLDAAARDLVQTAAVIGERTPRAWLAHAAALAPDAARAGARAAVDAGVLVADGDGYAFRHALLRAAVVDELLPDERVALHRSIATALTEHPECGIGVDRVAELGRHWDAAEDAPHALRWLVAAGEHELDTFAFEAAHHAYERALVWWDAVADASAVAGIDHAGLLLDAAGAAGLARRFDRAVDLARRGLAEAFAADVSRGVDATGRVYSLFWSADRAAEVFEFSVEHVLPVLDTVEPSARARFLVAHAEHLAGHGKPDEIQEAVQAMMRALDGLDDPVLAARAHLVHAWYLADSDGIGVDAEYETAAALARRAGAPSMLALVLLNWAAHAHSRPDLGAAEALLDELDELIEQYGLGSNLVPVLYLRSRVACLRGYLPTAQSAVATLDSLFVEGIDAWSRASARALTDLFAGDYEAVVADLNDGSLDAALPQESEIAVEIAALRADAHAWQGDLAPARQAIDEGARVAEEHLQTYWQGWLAMAGMRVEADVAEAASVQRALDEVERAESRAARLSSQWFDTIGSLSHRKPLAEAHSRGIAAEWARLTGTDAAIAAELAERAFDDLSIPYYALYFGWRRAEALLADGERVAATELLKSVRGRVLAHGFSGLERAITALARRHQLRLGPGRTNVDGEDALSERELEVLRLLVDGRSNPEIAASLYISRRTATAHVSNILRKLDATSRVEAASEALRRGYV